jgi:hypothetical protein
MAFQAMIRCVQGILPWNHALVARAPSTPQNGENIYRAISRPLPHSYLLCMACNPITQRGAGATPTGGGTIQIRNSKQARINKIQMTENRMNRRIRIVFFHVSII